jgi:hypothetical protein
MPMNTRIVVNRILSGSVVAGLVLCAAVASTDSQAQPAAKPSAGIPDFSSNGRTWVLASGTAFLKVPGDTGPGPITDKNFPGAAFDAQRGGGARTQNRIADTSNPILKPWAKKLMDIANTRVAAGGIPFVDDSRCWLGGVPSLLLFPGEAVVFLQTPKEVWILEKRDSQVRRILLDVPHSKDPGYSWTGESVGHYENGDTLVVDTIGLDAKGPLDRYRTPHTRQMHVVERYHLNNGGKGMEITFTVDDPGAFTMPWKAKVDFRAGTPPRSDHWEEDICADNGDGYGFDPDELVPLPHADKPDF